MAAASIVREGWTRDLQRLSVISAGEEANGGPPGATLRARMGKLGAARRPSVIVFTALLATGTALVATNGLRDVAQTGINGLSLGAVIALGAVGLTLVYGILKLVNFAHGDFLTFGAYAAFVSSVSLGLPIVAAIGLAMAATALLGLLFEHVLWRPMRARGAGLLQMMLVSLALALFLRNTLQFFAGTEVRVLGFNRTTTAELLGLRIGEAQLIVMAVGLAVLVAVGCVLRLTTIGKRMRALSDDLDLAESAGIDTSRVITYTWIFAGALAGLAGVLFAGVTNVKPELGFELLLPIFAAVVLGGIGDSFGALVAGLFLGVAIEWSTLVVDPGWKLSLGFIALIIALIVRPQGIFGRARAP